MKKNSIIIIFFVILIFIILLTSCVRKRERGEPWSEFADVSCNCRELENTVIQNSSLVNSINSEKFTRIIGKPVFRQTYEYKNGERFIIYYSEDKKVFGCGCLK